MYRRPTGGFAKLNRAIQNHICFLTYTYLLNTKIYAGGFVVRTRLSINQSINQSTFVTRHKSNSNNGGRISVEAKSPSTAGIFGARKSSMSGYPATQKDRLKLAICRCKALGDGHDHERNVLCVTECSVYKTLIQGADLEGGVGWQIRGCGKGRPQWGPGAKPRQRAWGRSPHGAFFKIHNLKFKAL